MTTTRGRGRDAHRRPGRPRRAARAAGGRARCPASTSRSPSATSSPARRTCWPSSGAWVITHLRDAAVGPLVGHHRVGAGGHRGAGHDLDRGARATSPAAWPARRRSRRPRAGAPARPRSRRRRRARHTAYPSIAELSKPGSGDRGVRRPRRPGRPNASISGWSKAGSGVDRRRGSGRGAPRRRRARGRQSCSKTLPGATRSAAAVSRRRRRRRP